MTEIQKKNSIRHKAATFALALCTVLAGCTAPAVPTAGAVPAISAPVTVIQPEEQAVSAADLWSDDRSRTGTPLLDVPLAAETQWAIFEQCGQDASLFCAVMAIASVESGFDPQTVGDGGGSLGMMQINTRWHTGRMEALGVTDLTDPVQCAAVAVDYLLELEGITGAGTEDHQLYTSYNAGPSTRTSPTDYSKAALDMYWAYIAEMATMA